jgi:hypothetical protein
MRRVVAEGEALVRRALADQSEDEYAGTDSGSGNGPPPKVKTSPPPSLRAIGRYDGAAAFTLGRATYRLNTGACGARAWTVPWSERPSSGRSHGYPLDRRRPHAGAQGISFAIRQAQTPKEQTLLSGIVEYVGWNGIEP